MLISWMSPKWRTVVFLVLVNLAWILAAWIWTERGTWLWITPIALSINVLLLTYDQLLSFSNLESTPLSGHDSWGILKTVHNLCEKLHVPEPKVFLVENPAVQIFCYARTRNQARLFITKGALTVLKPKELEAALTFQILASRRSLTLVNYWCGAILDVIFRFGKFIERGITFIMGWTPPIGHWLIIPAFWILKLFLLTPSDIEKMDKEVVFLSKPQDLANSIWKMDAYSHTVPWPQAVVFGHMCIVNPINFRVHPCSKNRIRNLTGHYPF